MAVEKKDLKAEDKVGLEHCVLCGGTTGIRRDTHIQERKYYVETAGQLCAECYAEIYMPVHNDDLLNF